MGCYTFIGVSTEHLLNSLLGEYNNDGWRQRVSNNEAENDDGDIDDFGNNNDDVDDVVMTMTITPNDKNDSDDGDDDPVASA